MAWDRKVPFQNGRMMEWSNYTYPDVRPDMPVLTYFPTAWEDAKPFNARLRYSGYHKGRSAVRFEFVDVDRPGRQYSTGMAVLHELIPRLVNGEVSGTWCFAKRGANYILVRALKTVKRPKVTVCKCGEKGCKKMRVR